MLGDVFYCHQCECYHEVGTECPGPDPDVRDMSAVETAIGRLGIWGLCVQCWKISNLTNLFVCPSCYKHGWIIYLEIENALDAHLAGIPGALDAAKSIAKKAEDSSVPVKIHKKQ